MSEDIKFKLITYVDTNFEAKTQECEYFIELEDGVERSLKDILKENIEQQVTINEYKKDNAKWRRKCLDLLVIIRTELLPRISDDEVRRLKEIVDNG